MLFFMCDFYLNAQNNEQTLHMSLQERMKSTNDESYKDLSNVQMCPDLCSVSPDSRRNSQRCGAGFTTAMTEKMQPFTCAALGMIELYLLVFLEIF